MATQSEEEADLLAEIMRSMEIGLTYEADGGRRLKINGSMPLTDEQLEVLRFATAPIRA